MVRFIVGILWIVLLLFIEVVVFNVPGVRCITYDRPDTYDGGCPVVARRATPRRLVRRGETPGERGGR
jgi:hypothetical protein